MHPESRTHDSYAAFRTPAFQRYFAANSILFLGLQMQRAAVGWEIYERTGAVLDLGLAGLAGFLPTLFLSPIAGHFTDTYDRKKVLNAAILVTALGSLGFAWNSATHGPIFLIYAFLALTSAARAFWFPARASFLPRIVTGNAFTNAVSWNSTSFELAATMGPAAAGILLGTVKMPVIVYGLNVIFAALSLAFIASIPYRHEAGEHQPLTAGYLLGGIRHIWKTPVVLSVMSLDMLGVLFGGATALMPVYAKDILQVGASGFGILLAAPSVGAAAMALIQAHRHPFERAGRAMLVAVAGFGLATVVFGLSHSFMLSFAMLLLLGACDNISVVIRTTLIQTQTPDAVRGRVSAINGVFIAASNDLGGFESGVVAARFGPTASVVSGGFGTLLVVALAAGLWPQLRKYGRATSV